MIMKFNPKLKNAMEEIKSILNEYDIAGSVILHSPGFSEYFTKINPSYSCAKFDGDGIRVKAKLNEDFNGDKKAWNKKVTDTVNMIEHIADVSGKLSLTMFSVIEMLEKYIDIESEDGNHTSHTTQNN